MSLRPIAVTAAALIFGLWRTALADAGTPAAPDRPNETLLTFHQSAEVSLPADVLRISLRAEAIGADPSAIQKAVNKAMGQALAKAKAIDGIEASTGGYFVSDTGARAANRGAEWRAVQSLILLSHQFDRLLQLVGDLQQDGLLVDGMAFELSAEARRPVQDRLLNEVLAAVRDQAAKAATAMDMKVVGFRALHLGQSFRPMPLRAAAAPMAKMIAPSAEPAAVPVSIDVDAEALLSR